MKIVGLQGDKLILSVDIRRDDETVRVDGKVYYPGSWMHSLVMKGDMEQSWLKAAKVIETGNQVVSGESVIRIDVKELVSMATSAALGSGRKQRGPVKVQFKGVKGYRTARTLK